MQLEKMVDPRPAFPKNNIPIALSCSEYYSPYAAVYLKSLLNCSSSAYGYDILIFTKDITPKTMKMLGGVLEGRENISLRFLDVDQYLSQYALKVHDHFGVESYFRLLYPYMLTHYGKVIYCDCDMVLKSDIAELYQEEIGNAFLGACIDAVVVGAINDPSDRSFGEYGWMGYCRNKLHMENPYLYLNSGVLVFNLARFRQEYTAERVLQDAQDNQYYLLDQDALNTLCGKDVVILNLAWNMTTDVAGLKWPYIQKAPHSIRDAYLKARMHPHTVHFADWLKPWTNPNEDLGYEFWNVARELPIYTQILARMSGEQMNRTVVSPAELRRDMQPMGVWKEWKWTVKRWSAVILPYGSKRRRAVKRWYFKLRRWKWVEEP